MEIKEEGPNVVLLIEVNKKGGGGDLRKSEGCAKTCITFSFGVGFLSMNIIWKLFSILNMLVGLCCQL